MMNYLTDLTDDWVEFEGFSETITLEPELFDQALDLSHQLGNEARQWQVYLQALALLSFEEWLQQREPEFSLNAKYSSILQPQYANAIDAVCNLTVGNFKICLIPTVSFSDEEVTVPRAVVDLPELMAHFYVIISIEEELELATIKGFLRYDQLVNYQSQLQPEADWTYQLPLAWFNHESDELLLDLQCLDPTAITLPEIPTHRQLTLARMQAALLTRLPQLRNRPLWQGLTWEQGIAVLTTPDLLNWLYQSLTENAAALTEHLSDLLRILTQPAVNVRRWLGNQIDDVMQDLSWDVLPALSPLRGIEPMREVQLATRRREENPARDLDEILTEISRIHALEIPAIAGRAYRDLTLGLRLRIFAVTWSLRDNDGWTLLLILKAMSGEASPYKLTLRVSDRTEVLSQELLQPDSPHDYIFTLVEGSYEDKFLASITSATGEVQTLPPFAFLRD